VSRKPYQRRVIHFAGQVQGVGFRYTAMRAAGNYDVTGYVRNLPDGRVEMLVEGAVDEVDAFVLAIKNRMGSYIFQMHQQVAAPTGEYRNFNIRL